MRVLAVEALDRVRAAITAAAPAGRPVPEALTAVAETVLPMADEMRFLDAGPEVWDLPELRDAWWTVTGALAGIVDRGKREGDLRPDLSTEVMVDVLTGALWGVANGIDEGRVAPHRAAAQLADLVLRGAQVTT